MQRRTFLKTAGYATVAGVMMPGLVAAKTSKESGPLAVLEKEHGGRLGVMVLDTATGKRLGHRADQRFLMCSTFKLPLVAAVLQRVDAGEEQLGRRVVYDSSALLKWAPVTQLNVGAPGMSVQGLCEAAMLMSDNTAANLLLDTLGGPAALTRYVRTLGDEVTRMDRREPFCNRPDGDKDTTTPSAMLADMRKVILGDALAPTTRALLRRWFRLNQTGAHTLKAGMPFDWVVGDKTGSASGINNDIAVATPPGRKPLLVTACYVNKDLDTTGRKAVLAEVGRVVASSMRP